MNSKGVSIFLPGYNEEKILSEHVSLVYKAAKKLKRPFELVIVDDSSKDSTPLIAKELSKRYKEIFYKRFENGPSKRENLAVAMNNANYPTVVFMDMDLAVDLSYLQNLVNEIDKGNDISTGSRFMGVNPKREPHRLIISWVYNKLWRYIFGSKIKDHQCGFKATKKSVLMDLIQELGYDNKIARGWFWDAEFLIRAQKKGYKVTEFPVTWNAGKQSAVSVKRELPMIPYILKFIFTMDELNSTKS